MGLRQRDEDHEAEWGRAQARRIAVIGLIAAVFVAGVLFVYWLYRSLGLGKVGEFYKQADDIEIR